MSSSRRALHRELDDWKRLLPGPAKGSKAAAAKELRDNLRSFTFRFRDWLEEAMRPQGMTLPQLRMLFAVRYERDASSAAIARLCQVTPQTMQAMLQRAVRQGWLVRRPAAQNARILVSALTPEGDALLQQAIEATAAFELQVWRDASTPELQAINVAFSKALQRIEQAEIVPVAGSDRRKPKSAAKR